MTHSSIHPHDVAVHRRLMRLSRKQLAAIKERLSGKRGRLGILLFVYRNWRLKMSLLKLLGRKERRLGEQGLAELLSDFKIIESDENLWAAVGKEEVDYATIILHGLREVTSDAGGLLDESA